ncbi:MAG: bifunctional 2',3'-cyclic-nucleotide 2'-phosphodiesterase/3'-nucleotidase [Pseudomonadota bacterium]
MPADAPTGAPGGRKGARLRLRILATTDLHMHLLGYDYYTDRPSDEVGLARTASLIAAARDEAVNVILLDNGDTLQGTPLGDCVAAEDRARTALPAAQDAAAALNTARGLAQARNGGAPHPMIAAMNALGYDAAALGNHDLAFGPDFLDRALSQATFPVLSANLARRLGAEPLEDALFLPPTALLDRVFHDDAGEPQRLRIGLIGLLPPQTEIWESGQIGGHLRTRCMIDAARAWLPGLKAAGAEIVIALAHTGIDARPPEKGMENAALHLAALPQIDALIAGHVHGVFPGPDFQTAPGIDPVAGRLHGTAAVMPGFWGSHLGVIDLILKRRGESWHVTDSACAVRPIAGSTAPWGGETGGTGGAGGASQRSVAEDAPVVLAAAQAAHARALQVIRQPVGYSEQPLHSYFALVADAPALAIVAAAQSWHLSSLVGGTALAGLPCLSAVSPFKAGGRAGPLNYTDVPAGPLTQRHIADLYLYPNKFCAVRLDGAALAEWLEMSASLFHRIAPGSCDAMLIDPAFPNFNFDVISGLRYRIDLSIPPRYDADGKMLDAARRRVTAITHAGRALEPDALFLVATNDYRAAGGGYFAALNKAETVIATTETNRDILARFVAQTGPAAVPQAPVWRFSSMPGTTVLFDSGPDAAAHIPSLSAVQVTPAGATPLGFARFRLHL